ncbi:CRISPR-associated protein Cas2 [Arcanobacterium pluranimalium]|uniref:type I-E CRISPR-associated endoribonuclease Cas2e n=1 Tax=Arcanobacterium pluranimalium TaxID=108028 RepID=UPI00195B25DC|nr:type I-E CRISPR-associated endoribonuclease Cas2e [Arcanobacterium pluranimalium]MBM7824574.1 CRISPR-associated protein Cas2 [Arcanobacterium pluranimalium]
MFVVVSTSNVPAHMHGYLSRFLAEANVGLYVGTMSRVVVERLWERISTAVGEGSITMVMSDSQREQGFSVLTAGPQSRQVSDCDGVTLICGSRLQVAEKRDFVK